MRYLFFDIECSNGRNICEFGYVITDTDFNVIKMGSFIINPESNFNLQNRSDGRDIKLFYSKNKYYDSMKFPYFYDMIKEIIEYPYQLILGHAIINDAKFLNNACKRYELAPINFRFADTQRIYSEYANIKNSISLENAGDYLNVERPRYMHKSDDDSLLTMRLVKQMCKEMDCTLEELIELCDSCKGENKNFIPEYDDYMVRRIRQYESVKSGLDNYMKGGKFRLFLQFLDGVKPQGNIIESPLNGKSICVSMNYEIEHFKEMLSLVQLLTNHNATYKLKASENDIFVSYPVKDDNGNIRYCSRLDNVNKAISEGKDIKIITFDELLSILNVKEEELSTMTFPDITKFCDKPKSKKKRKTYKIYHSTIKSPTIGDLWPELFELAKDNN